MPNRAEARAIVEQRISPLRKDEVLVQDELPHGWAFHVQSREHVETGDINSQLIGGLVYVVLRSNGALYEFSRPDEYEAFIAGAELSERD